MVSGCDGSIVTLSYGGDGSIGSLGFGCDGIISSIDCCEDVVATFTDDVVFVVSYGIGISEQFGTNFDDVVFVSPDGPMPSNDVTPIEPVPEDEFVDDVPVIIGAGALGSGFSDSFIVFGDLVRPPDDDGGFDITKTPYQTSIVIVPQ